MILKGSANFLFSLPPPLFSSECEHETPLFITTLVSISHSRLSVGSNHHSVHLFLSLECQLHRQVAMAMDPDENYRQSSNYLFLVSHQILQKIGCRITY